MAPTLSSECPALLSRAGLYLIERYSIRMGEDVKGRDYDNTRREAAARVTRRAVVDAARDLFLETGYPTATLRLIAERAEVSVQTVYARFGNKRAILKAVIDQT